MMRRFELRKSGKINKGGGTTKEKVINFGKIKLFNSLYQQQNGGKGCWHEIKLVFLS